MSLPGTAFVLSAPSGTGKSTLAKRLVASIPGLIFSISYTTRPPRAGEVDGEDYFFVDDATFDRMVEEGEFIEWVQVYKHRYGTGRKWLQRKLEEGVDILLDIETIGAQSVHKSLPDAVMIFLLPPSADELAKRLRGRGNDSADQVRIRLNYARHEMVHYPNYDYLIVNDDADTAYRNLESVFLSTRLRYDKTAALAEQILNTFPHESQEQA